MEEASVQDDREQQAVDVPLPADGVRVLGAAVVEHAHEGRIIAGKDYAGDDEHEDDEKGVGAGDRLEGKVGEDEEPAVGQALARP